MNWYLIMILTAISLMTYELEHLFMHNWPLANIPLMKCLFKTFARLGEQGGCFFIIDL